MNILIGNIIFFFNSCCVELAHFEGIRCHLQLRHSVRIGCQRSAYRQNSSFPSFVYCSLADLNNSMLQFGVSAQFAGTWQLFQGYGEKGMGVSPYPWLFKTHFSCHVESRHGREYSRHHLIG
jgi:hypothetical protein